MNVQSKFHWDATVEVCGEGIDKLPQFKKLMGKKLYISGVQFYQSRHFREGAYTDSYLVAPIEYQGFEHDEDVWIGGCNLRLVVN